MINRDFSKSGKDYIKQNKIVLITLAIIALIGVIMMCVFGFKGGSDIKGSNTFSIVIGTNYQQDKLDEYSDSIESILAEHDGALLSVQVAGEGSLTKLVVKYNGTLDNLNQVELKLSNTLKVNQSDILEHTTISPSVTSKDYIYTIACGLIIVAVVAIYTAIRYNLACTITAIGSSLLGVLLLMSVTSILRLTINSSFLAINIITMLLILCENFMLFDGIEKVRAESKDKNDRSAQLTTTLRANSFRQKIMYGALFAISLIMVILMPNLIKQVSLIVLFATVITMFVTVYAIPFLWCLTITQVSDKIRAKKVEKVKPVKTTEEVEGELEQKYTENQVIEVKESNDEDYPTSDDNITIE